MNIIKKSEIPVEALPGRGLQRTVGQNSVFESVAMTVGYACYCAEYGEMEPHNHAEETVLIFSAERGAVHWGNDKDNLTETKELKRGMVLHIPEGEWHKFTYEPGGHVEIVFIYGTAKNIRPEDNK